MFYDNGMSEQELIKIRIYQKEKSAYFMRVYRITVVFNIIGRSLLCSSFQTEKSLRLTSILHIHKTSILGYEIFFKKK